MWPDDKYWLPLVLAGKFVTAKFVFGEGETITEHKLNVQPITSSIHP